MAISAELLDRLGREADQFCSTSLIHTYPELKNIDVVITIADHVNRLARENLQQAERFANLAVWLADLVDDDFCRGRAARCVGNVNVLRGNYSEAMRNYERAFELFQRIGARTEQAATISSTFQPLIYLGRNAEAFDRAGDAISIASECGDELLLARIELNFGNILHRQDRFASAVEHYQAALTVLRRSGQLRDAALALLNLAVCYISMNDFARAESAYQEARFISEKENMPRITSQADYNIAYLHYYRGEYAKAIELYRNTKRYCEEANDDYHRALCDLDQAEMYLELHLHDETANLAQIALTAFEKLNMPYEVAKATVWKGIAAYQDRKPFRSIECFEQAKNLMAAQGNTPWVAILGLFQATILRKEGRYFEALKVCKCAQQVFDSLPNSAKSVHANLLRASLHLDLAQTSEAATWLTRAQEMAEALGSAHLSSDVYRVFGKAAELRGATNDAAICYRRALECSKQAPLHSGSDALKIPYSGSACEIHEAVTALALSASAPYDFESIFEQVELGKSRNAAELLSFRAIAIPASTRSRSPLVEQLKALRQELNWYYRQSGNLDLLCSKADPEKANELRRTINDREIALLNILEKIRNTDEEFYSIQSGSTPNLKDVQRLLSADEVFIDFFDCRGSIWAFLVTCNGCELVPVTRTHLIRTSLRRLQGHLLNAQPLKAGIADECAARIAKTCAVLQELYAHLIQPIRRQIEKRRLIIVPTGPLNYVPFQALFNGREFLTEEFLLSYAGSASQHCLNASKSLIHQGADVFVGGIPLDNYSAIVDFKYISDIESLRQFGSPFRCLHLDCELKIREDNPFFSSLRIGENETSIVDFFDLDIASSVLTLRARGAVMRASGNGDEIQGLTRALEYAGARTVLVPIWSLEGQHNAFFFESFYREMTNTRDRALAFQTAMSRTREHFPDPFCWSAFRMQGQTGNPQ